ncbi:hypothetical protein [Sphingomonas sp. Leaf38]|uniref:hypothetical protein n=1 Tax=Sphingomonas sp. Leaf38 TaxID=1736217 RepID=UPI000700BA45|nr:hypothetical protein [Sphingomonas sp. Leaf38]KQN33619.1 hypothetical protein ASE88_00880 [Sphingomonas sp. Leaf38]
MLVAQKAQAEPLWTPVMGASVLFAPITRPMLRRARRAALEALGTDGAEGGETASVTEQMEELGDALSFALIVAGVLDWRDVCVMADDDDTGTGVPLECTDENKAMLLADPLTFEAFDAAYVIPFVQRERERAAPGKESSPSQDGISTQATGERIIAGSPAPLATATDAPNAPTSSTKRRPKPKKTSGTS